MKLETRDLNGITMKLVKPHAKNCPHVLNQHPGSRPWYLVRAEHRDRLGRRNGDACLWLVFKCWCDECDAELMVAAYSIQEALPSMIGEGK